MELKPRQKECPGSISLQRSGWDPSVSSMGGERNSAAVCRPWSDTYRVGYECARKI